MLEQLTAILFSIVAFFSGPVAVGDQGISQLNQRRSDALGRRATKAVRRHPWRLQLRWADDPE